MYESKNPYYYGTGRRKSSVARVRLYAGTGKITINGRDIDDYFGLETLKLIVRQPMALTDTLGQFDVVCTVAGGGGSGFTASCRSARRSEADSWLASLTSASTGTPQLSGGVLLRVHHRPTNISANSSACSATA